MQNAHLNGMYKQQQNDHEKLDMFLLQIFLFNTVYYLK